MRSPARFFLIAVGVLFIISACNTIEGVGKDVRGAGEAITGSAQQTKEKIKSQ